MHAVDFHFLAVQRQALEGALVGLGEVGLLEVAFGEVRLAQELLFDDVLLLQFLVSANHIEAGVEFVGELLAMLLGLLSLLVDLGVHHVERVHAAVQVLDLDVGLTQLLGEAGNLLLLILELLFHRFHGFLHLGRVTGGLLEALFEFGQSCLAVGDAFLDEHHVVAQLGLAVGSLGVEVLARHDLLHILDLIHSLANLVHERHEAVLLGKCRREGVVHECI